MSLATSQVPCLERFDSCLAWDITNPFSNTCSSLDDQSGLAALFVLMSLAASLISLSHRLDYPGAYIKIQATGSSFL